MLLKVIIFIQICLGFVLWEVLWVLLLVKTVLFFESALTLEVLIIKCGILMTFVDITKSAVSQF